MKLRPCTCNPSLTVEEASRLDTNFFSVAKFPDRKSGIPLGYPGPISSCQTGFLFAYDIFPQFVLRAEPQWIVEKRAMRVGDVIVQRVVLPPIGFGLCAEFAVRICALISEPKKLGFAYETLAGHLERGVSEFYFEEQGNALLFVIQTRSEPGHWLSRLAGPFTLGYQKWCTRRALRHVRKRFKSCNPRPLTESRRSKGGF